MHLKSYTFHLGRGSRAMAATWILAVEVKKLVVEGHEVADLWMFVHFRFEDVGLHCF